MASQEEIDQQKALLSLYRNNVALYLRQQAQLGSSHIPPGVANGLIDARFHIQRIKKILSSWGVSIDDHPDDDPHTDKEFVEWLANLGREIQSVPSDSGHIQRDAARSKAPQPPPVKSPIVTKEPIKIMRVVVDEVTFPKNDGTKGSALYRIPFQLSGHPSTEWAELFVATWNRPPQFTTMHRPGIARVVGDRVILDGTTIEEVEQYHRDTLVLVVDQVNQIISEREQARQNQLSESSRTQEKHIKTLRDISDRLKFD